MANLRVGYESDNNWYVQAYAENLFNEFTLGRLQRQRRHHTLSLLRSDAPKNDRHPHGY
jgi:hypothetical protein